MRRRLLVIAPLLAATLAINGLGTVAHAASAPLSIFPNDTLTVADASQLTGRRLNMPMTNCAVQVSNCNEIALIDALDGFDLDPNVKVRFSGPIDVSKVNGTNLYLERVCSCARVARIPLVRLVWDAATHSLYGHPKRQLRESSTYRVTVASGINGQSGTATFTTMSASVGLRQMQAQLDDGSAYTAAGIGAADRGLHFVRPNGTRTVYPAANVTMVRRFDDTGSGPLVEQMVLDSAIPAANTYGFGSFLSPSWLDADRKIPQSPTRTGAPAVTGFDQVGFTLILPTGVKPAGGWPVAIFGPGITRSKYDLFLASDENLKRGIATIAIDPVGHAFGPRSEAAVDLAAPPSTVRFSGFGRGVDLNHDGTITDQEGVSTLGQPSRYASIALRDGLRQTAADNMALVRAIGRGVDVDGDGTPDLRPTGVDYYAQSLGGIYGTMVMGVDPLVQVGALNVPGGPIVEIARLSPAFRPVLAAELAHRIPSLLNGGPGADGFTESAPLYLDPPVTNPYPGAIPIQLAGARTNWIDRPGSPETFAPLERKRPPAGHPVKKVLYQFAFGDMTVPNPTSATLSRAGRLFDIVSYYRNDLTPTASTNPHGFLLDPRISGRQQGQLQIATFFASAGTTIIDPDGPGPVWETPIANPNELETTHY